MRIQHGQLVSLTLALIICGCAGDNPLILEDPSYSSTGVETFIVRSFADPRLPAPGLEAASATAEDRELFGRLSARPSQSQGTVSNPVAFWNRVTTELGLAAKLPPPLFARAYALVHVGIFDATVVSGDQRRGRLPEHTVVAGVAAQVLNYLFPQSTSRIEAAAAEQISLDEPRAGAAFKGWALGRAVGKLVVMRAKSDGSDTPFAGPVPTGEGIWAGENPVLPMCGSWRTWVIGSGSEIQPPAPYAFGSPQDLADVQEVLDVSLHRTADQIAAVHKWADLPPPTIWNGLLNDRIEAQGLGLIASAQAHAYLSVAMADAFICCWATKYNYWTARPFQRIPSLVTVIPTPNFPSYTSGHSTISAAAAAVMAEVFPAERGYFLGQAQEAALSRLWGGIHFRQDNEQGMAIGRRIGELVVERMRAADRLKVASRG